MEEFKRRFPRSGSLGIPFVPEEDVRELFSEKAVRFGAFRAVSHGFNNIFRRRGTTLKGKGAKDYGKGRNDQKNN